MSLVTMYTFDCRNRGVVLCCAADGDPGAGGRLRRDPLPHVDGGRAQRRRRGDHQGTVLYTCDVCTEGEEGGSVCLNMAKCREVA